MSWFWTIVTPILGLGAVGAAIVFAGVAGPALAIATPILEAIGKGIAQIIGLFVDGVAKCFANPTTILVVAAAMAYGGFAGGQHEKKKQIAAKPKTVATSTVKSKPKPEPAYKSMWPFPNF